MSYASLFDEVPETSDTPAWKPDVAGTELLGKVVAVDTVTLDNDFGVKEAAMWTVEQENGELIRMVGARTVLGNQMAKHPNPIGHVVRAVYKGTKGGGNRRQYHDYTVQVAAPGGAPVQAATPTAAVQAPPWAS